MPPNVLPIDGSATLTMNRSRFTIAMPAVTTANTAAKRAVPLLPAVLLPTALSLPALVSITPSVTRPPVAIAHHVPASARQSQQV